MNLLIDTHFNDVNIILSKDNKIIKQRNVTNEKQNSKYIMPLIKKILGKEKPTEIIVVNGPGSFTGVRLGVTIAKTLAFTLKIPIKTITSLECLAVSIDSDEKIIGLSDNNGYYIGIFNSNNVLIGNYEYLSNSEYEEFSEKYKVLSDIEIDYVKVLEYAEIKKEINPHEVNPIYIKKIDVEKNDKSSK